MTERSIVVESVSKRYEIYARPSDRLRQFVLPRLARGVGAGERNYFREFWALRDVSLELRRGEAFGILGKNGAGKSTLLQIIAGTLAPTTGRVAVAGRVAALLELGSGFSPEFTGIENVRLNAALLGLKDAEIDRKLEGILAFADIGQFAVEPVKTYSSGMVMRLAFAVSTAVEPDVLIVDEALAVGDAKFQKRCFARLEELRRRGTTILFVTHDMGTVTQFCSRAMLLNEGQVLRIGEPRNVCRAYHRLLFATSEEAIGDVAAAADDDSARARPEHETVVEPAAEDLLAPAVAEDQSHATEPAPQAAPSTAIEAGAATLPATEAFGFTPSSHETRYGNGLAQIAQVDIRKPLGESVRVLEVGERYEFRFVAQARADVGATAYGFIIANAKGQEVYGTKSGLFGLEVPPLRAGETVCCAMNLKLDIVPGRYLLTVALAHNDKDSDYEFLDYRFDVLEFQVIGTPTGFLTSVASLPAQLRHDLLPTAHATPAD
jgi:lipopolysaccharide transport system ATP-binding protein